MEREQYIIEVSAAQRKLNDLLMGAYQYRVKYLLSINSVNCCADDDRQAVGIKIYDNEPIYSSNGVP